MEKMDSGNILLIDSHVHIQHCFDMVEVLNNAESNFENAANKYFGSNSFTGVLFLTESSGINYFRHLSEQKIPSTGTIGDGWKITRTDEAESVIAEKKENKKLIIIAGRQIITKEKLEVLAIGTIKEFHDGLRLNELVDKLSKEEAVIVLPWGVGKWLGRRGKIVRRFIEESINYKFFLGDNSGRLNFGLTPKLFNFAVKKEIKILSGSDPLPFRSQEKKIGSFGFAIKSDIDLKHPIKVLKKLIFEEKIESYGKLETPFGFFRNQILMQIKKRKI
jgi:hypothetical protein